MDTPLYFSDHADLRCAQRNLSEDEVKFIIDHGERHHRAGAVFFHLRRCDVPPEYHRDQRIAKLVGSTVLVNKNGTEVITVYRNDEARKRDRRKSKHQS